MELLYCHDDGGCAHPKATTPICLVNLGFFNRFWLVGFPPSPCCSSREHAYPGLVFPWSRRTHPWLFWYGVMVIRRQKKEEEISGYVTYQLWYQKNIASFGGLIFPESPFPFQVLFLKGSNKKLTPTLMYWEHTLSSCVMWNVIGFLCHTWWSADFPETGSPKWDTKWNQNQPDSIDWPRKPPV